MPKSINSAVTSAMRYRLQSLLITLVCFGVIVAVNGAWIWYSHVAREQTVQNRE